MDAHDRTGPLLDAVLAIGEDLDLERLLDRVVQAAAHLVGARYAALGVLAPDGGSLANFLHHGIDRETAARIGDLPTGEGVLGQLVRVPRPLRLEHLGDHAASVDLPPGHPPMDSFLGVPVRIGSEVFGNLYLTEKPGGFTAEDEAAVVALASVAGSAIRNARTMTRLTRRERWRSAQASLATAVLGGAPQHEVFELVVAAVQESLGVAGAALLLPDADPGPGGNPVSHDAPTLGPRLVVEAAAGDVPDDLGDDPGVRAVVGGRGPHRWAHGMAVPFAGAEGEQGVLVAVGDLAGLVAPGELLQEVAAQSQVLVRYAVVREAGDRLALADQRARIARDLHDTTVQRVFAAGLRLDAVSRRLDDRPDEKAEVERTMDELDEAIRSLRELIGELGRPVELPAGDRLQGLVDGLRTVVPALQPLQLDGDADALPGEVVADLLAVMREGITNAARHAGAERIAASVELGDGSVLVRVVDDGHGPGGPLSDGDPLRGFGLGNLHQRASVRGGSCELGVGEGGGAVLVWQVPLG